MKLKTLLIQAALWAGLACPAMAQQNLTNNLRNGLYEEEANHNLPVAIQNYQALITRFDEERKLAATAVFRLAECYRKLGQTNEANAQYQRVAREFFDQTNLAELSRVYLGLTNAPGAAPSGAGGAPLDIVADGRTYHPASEEEAKELRHIITLTKDSPDLVNGLPSDDVNNPVSALQLAAVEGQIAVAQYLLAHGASVDGASERGQTSTPLALAAGSGHKTMVELLLSHHASVNAHPHGSSPPLHGAAKRGYNSVIEVLLAHGAEVNAKDSRGDTALHLAVGHNATVELLLARGADPNIKNLSDGSPLMAAAGQNQIESVKLLLQRHADPNAVDEHGETALHYVKGGRADIVELLLAGGALVDWKDLQGWGPLGLASAELDDKEVEVLLNHGADPNTKHNSGLTPLHWVWKTVENWSNSQLDMKRKPFVPSRALKIAELLVKHRGDVNAKDSKGRSVLVHVVGGSSIPTEKEVVMEWLKFLAANHADLDSRFFATQTTPLMWMVDSQRPNEEMIRFLLDHGADPNILDKNGATALSLARRHNLSVVETLLLAHGAVDRAGGRTLVDGTNAPSAGAQTNGTAQAASPARQSQDAGLGAGKAGIVLFQGEIKGTLLLKPGGSKSLSEAVLEMKPNEYANLKKVKLLREDPATKVVTSRFVDVDAILSKGKKEEDVVLQDGDSVVISAKWVNF